MGYCFINSSIYKVIVKKITHLFIFIDNEQGILHFKFAPLDYGFTGVYLQKCQVT